MQVSFLQVSFFLLAGVTLIVVLTVKYRVHAFFALLLACLLVGLGVGMPVVQVIATAKDGFGNIMKSLGLIIVLGTTLGAVLEYTGSTRVMADAILRITGEKRAAMAMTAAGFVVGMPIFCDSGFIVLSGLNKSLAVRTRTPMAYMAASLAGGLYAVHCLIPPHPGAAAAAGLIGVDYGGLILTGILAAIPAAIAGHVWARFAGRNVNTVLTTEVKVVDMTGAEVSAGSIEMSATAGNAGPGRLQAFLPVILPILLIAFTCDPVIALMAGCVLAIAGYRGWSRERLGALLGTAVEKAGSVLVIIGAGGAFGAILTATNIGVHLSSILPLSSLGLVFPFLLTSVLKTAQGSSTVAIITAASIVKPLLVTLGLATGNGPMFCVLAMGAGSMMISHANDAYFWVIARFSGLDMRTMLRVYTVASLLMGLTAMLAVYIISLIRSI